MDTLLLINLIWTLKFDGQTPIKITVTIYFYLARLSGKDKNSPLWQGTVIRTITEWNLLDKDLFSACEATASPFTTFKAKLSGSP